MEDRILQVGNLKKPRRRFTGPEEGRVYSSEGIAPTIKADGRTKIIIVETITPP